LYCFGRLIESFWNIVVLNLNGKKWELYTIVTRCMAVRMCYRTALFSIFSWVGAGVSV